MSQSTIIRPMTCANDVGAWLWPTIAKQGLEVEWTEIGNITGCWWPARGTRRQLAACWVIWCPQSYVRRASSRWFLVRPRPSGATSSPALSGETICFSKTPPDTLSPLSVPPLQVVSWWVPPAPIYTQIVKSGQIGLILQNLVRSLLQLILTAEIIYTLCITQPNSWNAGLVKKWSYKDLSANPKGRL